MLRRPRVGGAVRVGDGDIRLPIQQEIVSLTKFYNRISHWLDPTFLPRLRRAQLPERNEA